MKRAGKFNNPYMVSYLSLALICCLTLSVLFVYINNRNLNETRKYYNQKKVELLAEELEMQLQIFGQIVLQIKITDKYQPFFFLENRNHSSTVLRDFQQYSHYSALTKEYFLYYGGDDKVFHSLGNTIGLDVYLSGFKEEERQQIQPVLSGEGDMCVMPAGDNIYWLIPFEIVDSTGYTSMTLGVMVKQEDLEERFQIVSGGMNGNISLYKSGVLLYSNKESACTDSANNVLSAGTLDGEYKICYLPEKEGGLPGGFIPLQVLLILMTVLLVLIIANLYARRSYYPILEMTEKYGKDVPFSGEIQGENALEKIDYMIDSMLQNNAQINLQNHQKQELLYKQLLQMLISGDYAFDIQSYLDKVQLKLPGPFFYVISISFGGEDSVTGEFLAGLQRELNQITAVEEGRKYVYALCDEKKKMITVINSIKCAEQKEDLTEYVSEIARSYKYEPVFGVGNTYQDLSRVSASWMESVDNIHKNNPQKEVEEKQPGYNGSMDELQRFFVLLAEGDEIGATAEFTDYIKQFESEPISLLMQQYMFANFLSECTKTARRKQIELSSQSISLIVSAKNIKSFKEAVLELIHSFCTKVNILKDQIKADNAYRIYEYVNSHFTEYDLSIEKVSEDLNTTATIVRKSIFKYTGKMYKDYIICLRIEHAKHLLLTEEVTVSEICQQVGYGNLSYFIKLFKEMTGVTPAKYKSRGNTDN